MALSNQTYFLLQELIPYVNNNVQNIGRLPSDIEIAVFIRQRTPSDYKFTVQEIKDFANGINQELPYYSYQYAYDMLSLQLSEMIISVPSENGTGNGTGTGTGLNLSSHGLLIGGLIIGGLLLFSGSKASSSNNE